jgi:restriction endonuclease Mrr
MKKIGNEYTNSVFENIKHIIYIQAKFHKGISSNWAVEQLKAYNGEKDIDNSYSTSYWAISSGIFSDKAKETANKNRIRLINGDELANIILEVGIEGFSDVDS